MKINRIIITTIAIITLLSSCSETKRLKNETLKPYPTELEMGFHYRLFHHSKDASTLFVQSYAMEYRVTIRVYEDFRSKALVYENTERLFGDANSIQKVTVPIRLKQYALEILIYNTNDNGTFRDAILVDKTVTNNQMLLPIDEKNQPILKSYQTVGKKVKFDIATEKEVIYLRYFDNVYKPVLPPHVSQKLMFNPLRGTDKIYKIKKGEYFQLKDKGLYFVQTDSLSKQGLFLKSVDNNYPKLTEASDLTWSVRYITKNEEYKRLTNSKNDSKLELDRFWLARTEDKDRARNLISTYYNRIQLANEYFTTYKEGWKTDRGIIFTIFGQPTRVQKTAKYEYWYYRRTSERDFVEFIFDKQDGTYLLRRNPMYAQSWDVEIFAWRSGKI
ncbi:MAG: GWxTD domain-containing protein [Saprospiraceae bacterium]